MFGNKGSVNTSLAPSKSVNFVKQSSGAPAVDLTKLRESGHVDLAKKADKAGISLSKRGLDGIRAQAVLVLDHSGSMYSDYANGTVQQLVERALGFALQIDVDGTIPVIPFDSRVLPTVDVDVNNYQNVVTDRIWKGRDMGSTDLAKALKEVLKIVKKSDAPVFCVVVTDGSPDDRRATTDIVCELAGYPVFLKFLAVRPVDYLEYLDDLEQKEPGRRLLDNVDAKFIGDPAGMADLAFADAMTDEWDGWIKTATAAGVLTA